MVKDWVFPALSNLLSLPPPQPFYPPVIWLIHTLEDMFISQISWTSRKWPLVPTLVSIYTKGSVATIPFPRTLTVAPSLSLWNPKAAPAPGSWSQLLPPSFPPAQPLLESQRYITNHPCIFSPHSTLCNLNEVLSALRWQQQKQFPLVANLQGTQCCAGQPKDTQEEE